MAVSSVFINFPQIIIFLDFYFHSLTDFLWTASLRFINFTVHKSAFMWDTLVTSSQAKAQHIRTDFMYSDNILVIVLLI